MTRINRLCAPGPAETAHGDPLHCATSRRGEGPPARDHRQESKGHPPGGVFSARTCARASERSHACGLGPPAHAGPTSSTTRKSSSTSLPPRRRRSTRARHRGQRVDPVAHAAVEPPTRPAPRRPGAARRRSPPSGRGCRVSGQPWKADVRTTRGVATGVNRSPGCVKSAACPTCSHQHDQGLPASGLHVV